MKAGGSKSPFLRVGKVSPRIGCPGISCESEVMLDSGSDKSNWISEELVEKGGFRRHLVRKPGYASFLFPGQSFVPKHLVAVRVELPEWEFTLELEFLVAPRREPGDPRRADVYIGGDDVFKYELLEYARGKRGAWSKASEADEAFGHLDDISNEINMVGAATSVDVQDAYDDKICMVNFPKGEPERDELIQVIEHFRNRVIADVLFGGQTAKMTPAFVPFREGKTFEGVPARRYSTESKRAIWDWLQQMLHSGIIQRSDSTTTSPILVVKDPSGKFRFTQDAQKLNEALQSVQGAIPEIPAVIESLKGKKYLGAFDLVKAYFQCRGDPRMRKLWAFSTPFGNFEYTDRLPMGDKNVPVIFAQFMYKLMWGVKDAGSYFDDLMLGAKTKSEFIEKVREVLTLCEKYNVKISFEKMRLGYSVITSLGYDISGEGYKPRARNVEKFLNAPFPDQKHLKHWLGLLNVFRGHVSGINEVREAFREVSQKGAPWNVTEAMRVAFDKARQLVAQLQQMYHCRHDSPLFVDTDACDYGVGSIVYHIGPHGEIQPVGMDSQLLGSVARRWDTKSKEAYAIVRALKTYEHLLRGRKFTLRTDHKNLLWLASHADQKQHRWNQFISEFDFDLVYVVGSQNVMADALSRMHVVGDATQNEQELVETPMAQMEHTMDKQKEQALADIPMAQPEQTGDDALRAIFLRVHNTAMGHLGINKTIEAMTRILKEEGRQTPLNLRTTVAKWIGACMDCRKSRATLEKPKLDAHSLHGGAPFERVQCDFIKGLPETTRGNKFILVLTCCFTRFTQLWPVQAETAEVALEKLIESIALFGQPLGFVSDGGPAFKSTDMDATFEYFTVDNILTWPGRSGSHGIVERVNKEIERHLQHLIQEVIELGYDEWDLALPWVARILNNTVHSATGYAPCTMVFGTRHVEDRNLMGLTPKPRGEEVPAYMLKHNELLRRLHQASNEWQDAHILEQLDAQANVDLSPPLPPGSYVLRARPHNNPEKKVQKKWTGPFRVLRQVGEDAEVGGQEGNRRDDFYIIKDITQDQEDTAHRYELYPIYCQNDEEALQQHSKDDKELFIEEVLSHAGDPQRAGTVTFVCRCKGCATPVTFKFRQCRLVETIRDYITRTPALKSLRPKTIGENSVRKRKANKHLRVGFTV